MATESTAWKSALFKQEYIVIRAKMATEYGVTQGVGAQLKPVGQPKGSAGGMAPMRPEGSLMDDGVRTGALK